jgi:hypothetical protein
MNVSEQIAIMKAYEDGKTIERKGVEETEWKSLEYIEDYPFDFILSEYRIATGPKYRPYESVNEAFNEAKKHGFWVKNKSHNLRMIGIIEGTESGILYIGGINASEYLNNFVWADDGSPCGVKIG